VSGVNMGIHIVRGAGSRAKLNTYLRRKKLPIEEEYPLKKKVGLP